MMPTNTSGVFEPQTAYSFRMTYPPQSDEELKPCPFCGKDVELKHYKANGNDWWYVMCTNCRIAIDPMMWNDHVSKEEAIEIWNRRVKE